MEQKILALSFGLAALTQAVAKQPGIDAQKLRDDIERAFLGLTSRSLNNADTEVIKRGLLMAIDDLDLY